MSTQGQDAEDPTIRRINRTLDKLDQMESTNHAGNQNVTTVRFEGGAVGIWICVTLCLVMFAMSTVLAAWMHREFTRLDVTLSERKEESDRMQTYLSAIYAQAPQLKPKDEEKKDDARR